MQARPAYHLQALPLVTINGDSATATGHSLV